MSLSFVEGHLDGDGLQEFLADLDVNLGAGLGVFGLDESGADVLAFLWYCTVACWN